ncbi:MAG TPA: glycosyltransferase [Methyloprofundus sp.]|nr:glycosyltransferase [Methyloprofundus sp.]HIL77997.1 glycosyltransferase [Methylococcales bacterium]
MPDKEHLKLYKVEQLLIVHWHMQKPLAGILNFSLNEELLPKPFLAVQMASSLEMFIIVNAQSLKLTARKNSLSMQLTKEQQESVELDLGPITLLPKKLILSYHKKVQARFFTRLLQHTRQHFDGLDEQQTQAIIMRYAYPVKELYQIAEGQFFIRFPWDMPVDNKILPLMLDIITEQKTLIQQKQLGLWLDGAFHVFVKANSLSKLHVILNFSSSASIPLRFNHAEKLSRKAVLEKLVSNSSSKKALQSFLLPRFENKVSDKNHSPANPMVLKGHILGFQQQSIIGWVKDTANLARPVRIDIYENKQKITSILADQKNLQSVDAQAMGRYGFEWHLADEYLRGESRQIDFIYQATGEPLPGSPVKLGDGFFDFKMSIERGSKVKAYFQQRTLSDATFSIQLLLGGVLFSSIKNKGGNAFELTEELPDIAFNGLQHTVQVKIVNENDKVLYTKTGQVQHQYTGHLEQVDFRGVSGWIVNQSFPEQAVLIDIYLNDQYIQTTVCNQPRANLSQKLESVNNQVGFTAAIPDKFVLEPVLKIALYYKGTKTLVLPQETILTAKDTIIRSLVGAAEYLKSSSVSQDKLLTTDIGANTWARTQVIDPVIKALRQQTGIPQKVQLKLAAKTTQAKVNKSEIVDIIVPVYQGYEETIACIESVLQANNALEHQLIVINDYSPDGRLKYKLQALAKLHPISLIENSENIGFVKTVNKGMRLHPDRDVILLNSDTVVTDYWLDRLLAASKQDENIASVTPFSNNATICSFPQFNQDNSLPEGQSLGQLNALFYQYNQGEIKDLPTAIGFCMLIKREALLDVGYFDEHKWQHGYCEENDFCLRAANLGWRHVLACDVYVQHHGSVSFAETKQARITENLALLERMYPDYGVTVQRFIQQDPIAPQRNRVLKRLLQQQAGEYFLFVMHGLGGGAKAHGDHLAQLLEAKQQAVLELSVITKNKWQLQSPKSGYTLIYHYPQDYDQLLTDLSELGISRVHYHQVLGFPNKIWQLAEQLECSYDFTAHDFMPFCPRINLIDESGRYCGESQFDTQKCQRCIELNGVSNSEVKQHLEDFDNSVEKWRMHYATVLAKARYIFCPSNSTTKLYQQHLALPSIVTRPHPEESFIITPQADTAEESILSVAVIGAIGDHKGYQLLLSCAKNALKEGLPLRFVVIGYTRDDDEIGALANVSITGAYQNAAQLVDYIQQYHCRIAAFLSVWPETFSYTLTEALQHHLYPVALNYGAVAERVQALNYGQVVAEDSTPAEINKALLDARQKLLEYTQSFQYPGTSYTNIIEDYYHLGND